MREGDAPPTARAIPGGLDVGDPAALDAVRAVVAEEVAGAGRGRLVVVAPADVATTLRAHLRATLAERHASARAAPPSTRRSSC